MKRKNAFKTLGLFTMQNSIHKKLFFIAGVLAALVASPSSEAADITYETRALTGTDGPLGPQLGAGVFFDGFDLTPPALNSAGQVAFKAFITGAGVGSSNFQGVWSGGAGLQLVARAGSQAPGTDPGVNFDNFSESVGIDASGQTAFIASLVGAGVDVSNSSGIWSEGSGSGLARVARKGDPAPGFGPDVVFSGFVTGFNEPVFNSVGQTAFYASIVGPGVTPSNNDGIWSEGGGSGPQIIAREAEQAPGTDSGVNFGQFENPVLNNLGRAAFSAPLTGAGVDASNDAGIWSQGGGAGLQLIARKGDQAPGTDPGVNFGAFDFIGAPNDPAINDAGHTAFKANLTGAGVDLSNDVGIWSDGGGSGLQLIARTGSQAPDTDPGVNFRLLRVPVINAVGQTAFSAIIEGPGVDSTNDRGIWAQGPSGLRLIVRKGSQAPGAEPGVVLRSTGSGPPAFNTHGQIAFSASLEGPGVVSSNNSGVWATDPDGGLHMIAREGYPFDVSNDPLNPDMRTVFGVGLVVGSGGQDGRRASLNDNGQLAFFIEFADSENYSEGIFVANIGGPSDTPFKLTITPAIAPATGYDFAWDSQPGKLYDLLSSTDLATPIAEWPVHASYGDISATDTTTTLTAVPAVGPLRFFAVLEKDAPLAD